MARICSGRVRESSVSRVANVDGTAGIHASQRNPIPAAPLLPEARTDRVFYEESGLGGILKLLTFQVPNFLTFAGSRLSGSRALGLSGLGSRALGLSGSPLGSLLQAGADKEPRDKTGSRLPAVNRPARTSDRIPDIAIRTGDRLATVPAHLLQGI